MLGQIESYHHEIGVGIIKAEDGRKFRFACRDLINHRAQILGNEVDFELEDRTPRRIVVLAGSPWSVFVGSVVHTSFDTAPRAQISGLRLAA